MTVRAVVGLQWGDEGKGKIVDVLGETAHVVVRCQGGSNAGHTVVLGKDVFKLHLIPSGILRGSTVCVIGNGVVLDPVKVATEIEGLEERGVKTAGRLFLSDRAHLNLPFHKTLDGLREKALGKNSIGTTKQGIGPCYADKASRVGLRGHHLRDAKNFPALLRARTAEANETIRALGGEPLDPEKVLAEVLPASDKIRPLVADTVDYLHAALDAGKNILLEGAQGTMLDVDFGTYPFLTSSNTTAGGCATGSGLPPSRFDEVHGLLKAFTTRVGAGPFPTELTDPTGDRLRGTGDNQWDEYGTTTGRPRRCGWLDLVVGRYAARLTGLTHIHVTKLDVLSDFDELKVCVAYRLDGKRIDAYPASLDDLARCEPEYETFPGWTTPLTDCRSFAEFPKEAKAYVAKIESMLRAKAATVSVGPAREHTITCR